MMMTCAHCLRQFDILHGGSGVLLCCQCTHVKRAWLALEKLGVGQHNRYAESALAEHVGGNWCAKRAESQRLTGEEALRFLDLAGSSWIRDVIEDSILDAEEIE